MEFAMTFNPDIHHRQSIRLREYDYSTAGAYFLTVCVQNRECLFGETCNGAMMFTEAGVMVESVWNALPLRFPGIELNALVVMPNHFHGIIVLPDRRGESCIRPESRICPAVQGDHKDRPYGTVAGSVGRIVQAFKSLTTNAYIHGVNDFTWPPFPGRLWQRSFYERIIRNEEELNETRKYIVTNPLHWADDEENPMV